MKLSWRGITRLLFVALLLEQVAWGHLLAFTPLLLRDLGLAPADVGVWTGLLFTITMVVAVPLTPVWGVLGERYSRRLLIPGSFVLEAAACALFAAAPHLGLLIAARLLLGTLYAVPTNVVATQASFTPHAKLGTAIATVQVAQPIAASLGPPLGAVLIPSLGLRGLFQLDALLMITSAVLVAFLLPEGARRHAREPILSRTRSLVARAWRAPTVRWNFTASFAVRGATTVVDTYLPLRITQLAGPDAPGAIGLILGTSGALTALSTWQVGRLVDRIQETRLLGPAMVGGMLLTGALAVVTDLWLVGLVAAFRAIPAAISNTALFTHLARALPRERRAPVLGISPLPRMAGGLIFPALAAAVAPLWAGAALGTAALAYGAAALAARRLHGSAPPFRGDRAEAHPRDSDRVGGQRGAEGD